MNPATQPIFCLEDFELVNPPRSMAENFSSPYFHIRVKTKDNELVAAAMLSDLVKACQAHAPAEARYIEQLHWYVANGGQSDFFLIQAMEDEGFEVERLMLIYLENEPWWEHLRVFGRDAESLRLDAILYPDSKLAELEEMLFGFMVGSTIETQSAIAIAQAMQTAVWEAFPAMYDLHQKEVAGFIEKVSKIAECFMTSDAADYEEYLISGFKGTDGPFQAEFDHSLEGIQKQILEFRQKNGKQPSNAIRIKVELLEIDYIWLYEPRNTVRFWYEANCNEEVFYDYVCFNHLVEQAALHFPAWYYKIEALRDSIVAVKPKEKEIVDALLAEHFDFIPLIESFVNDWVDAQQCLAFEEQIRKYGNYKNNYDIHQKSGKDWGTGIEQARKMAILTSRLEDLAYDMVSEIFPDMIKRAKPWMIKSLKQSAHLLVFEANDIIWGLISQCEKKAA